MGRKNRSQNWEILNETYQNGYDNYVKLYFTYSVSMVFTFLHDDNRQQLLFAKMETVDYILVYSYPATITVIGTSACTIICNAIFLPLIL